MKTEQDSDVEKRLLLAIVLSMAILFGTPYVYEKLNITTPSPPEPVAEKSVEGPTLPSRNTVVVEEERREAPPGQVALPTSAEPTTTQVETEDLRLTFTNVGAVLTSTLLKGYASSDGEWLEMLPQELPADAGGALGLRCDDRAVDEVLKQAAWEMSGPSRSAEAGISEVTFQLRQDNIEATKRILVPARGYELQAKVEVRKEGRSLPCAVQLGPGIGGLDGKNLTEFQEAAVAYYQNGSVERYDAGDLEEGAVELRGSFGWAGLDSKYFACILLCPSGLRGLRLEQTIVAPVAGTLSETEIEPKPLLQMTADLGETSEFTFFIGPKNSEELSLADPTLSQLINFGEWLGVLVKPLLVALKFIHQYVENYGWAIIILTFLINLALFPFRYKQMASMQKMSAVQPQLKSVQAKYKNMKKDDPRRQEMNAEVMALYKKHGVNPLGGCLPLVLQMPILFAFYRMLYTSIELRGAPFMLWIQDLSKPDPYYITPIVMGVTMVAQQRMTPATGDPAQRRMMMFLPIVFTFFFLQVSSGLAIYFLFSNLVGMALQFMLQKLKPPMAIKGKKPAEKKKAKS